MRELDARSPTVALVTEIAEAISDEVRVGIVKILEECEELHVMELRSELADWLDREERAVHISLLHQHLPRLEEAGIIRRNRDTVVRGPEYQSALSVLTTFRE